MVLTHVSLSKGQGISREEVKKWTEKINRVAKELEELINGSDRVKQPSNPVP